MPRWNKSPFPRKSLKKLVWNQCSTHHYLHHSLSLKSENYGEGMLFAFVRVVFFPDKSSYFWIRCDPNHGEALWGQHRESRTSPAPCYGEGKKQYSDYIEDVSASSVYSISYTNPLPKSDLSCDRQIIQLSEVSGMAIASQLFCPSVFTDFLWAHEKTRCPPLRRALYPGWRSHSPHSLPSGKKPGCPFPVLIRKNGTLSSKM